MSLEMVQTHGYGLIIGFHGILFIPHLGIASSMTQRFPEMPGLLQSFKKEIGTGWLQTPQNL